MDLLIDNIMKSRPNLSSKSMKTYVSTLKSLFSKLTGKTVSDFTLEPFLDTKKVIDLVDTSPTICKSKVSIVIVLLEANNGSKRVDDAIKAYREKMNECNVLIKQGEIDQKKSEKQEAYWLEWDEVKKRYNDLTKKVKKQGDIKDGETKMLLPWILVSLYVLNPPRRLLDYSAMKYRNYDKATDNYLTFKTNRKGSRSEFVFNQYKTSKLYGTQTVPIDPVLEKILKAWIKRISDIEGDTLLLDTSVVRANGIINDIFGPGFGVNGLRHSYLSNIYKDVPKLQEIRQLENDLGNSFQTQLQNYVKVNERD